MIFLVISVVSWCLEETSLSGFNCLEWKVPWEIHRENISWEKLLICYMKAFKDTAESIPCPKWAIRRAIAKNLCRYVLDLSHRRRNQLAVILVMRTTDSRSLLLRTSHLFFSINSIWFISLKQDTCLKAQSGTLQVRKLVKTIHSSNAGISLIFK